MSYPKFEAQRVARLPRWKVTVTGETAAQRGAIKPSLQTNRICGVTSKYIRFLRAILNFMKTSNS